MALKDLSDKYDDYKHNEKGSNENDFFDMYMEYRIDVIAPYKYGIAEELDGSSVTVSTDSGYENDNGVSIKFDCVSLKGFGSKLFQVRFELDHKGESFQIRITGKNKDNELYEKIIFTTDFKEKVKPPFDDIEGLKLEIENEIKNGIQYFDKGFS